MEKRRKEGRDGVCEGERWMGFRGTAGEFGLSDYRAGSGYARCWSETQGLTRLLVDVVFAALAGWLKVKYYVSQTPFPVNLHWHFVRVA